MPSPGCTSPEKDARNPYRPLNCVESWSATFFLDFGDDRIRYPSCTNVEFQRKARQQAQNVPDLVLLCYSLEHRHIHPGQPLCRKLKEKKMGCSRVSDTRENI